MYTRILFFTAVFFSIHFSIFAQRQRVIALSGGASAFIPFEKNTTASFAGSSNNYTFSPVSSYFVSASGENAFNLNDRFSLSFPFSISYKETVFKFSERGLVQMPCYGLCDVVGYTQGLKQEENRLYEASVASGVKLSYSRNKWSVFTALNINHDLVLSYRINTTILPEAGDAPQHDRYGSTQPDLYRLFFNISSQNGLMYHLNEKVGVGLVVDWFFFNLNAFNPDSRNFQHAGNMSYGLSIDSPLFSQSQHVTSSIINTGLRLQYAF